VDPVYQVEIPTTRALSVSSENDVTIYIFAAGEVHHRFQRQIKLRDVAAKPYNDTAGRGGRE
jgi:hypothetical protein